MEYKVSELNRTGENGNGSIAPFTRQLAKWMEEYKPLFVGVDSTSTQKNTAETINALMFTKDELEEPLERPGEIPLSKKRMVNIFGEYFDLTGCPKLSGLDFSGTKKPVYLVSANFMLEARMLVWPKFVTGLRSQLSNYDSAKDRQRQPKIPQDLVCMLSMMSFVVKKWFYVDLNDEDTDSREFDFRHGRTARLSSRSRSQRSSRP
jgi:hypothetical protein